MATIYVGSARHDENNTYTGGTAGDQLQTSSAFDTKGEVSMQIMYTHSKGWYIIRAKSITYANAIAAKMIAACNNSHLGYDQNNRLGVIAYGISTTKDTECDCSALVRACVKEATGTDPGNFTTATEKSMLLATGLFEDAIAYVNQTTTPVYNGDILVTKTKGHTVIVTQGNPRSSSSATSSSTDSTSSSTSPSSTYTKTQFIKDVQTTIGVTVDGIAGSKTLAATVTVSASKNNKHAVVKPIQKYLYALGYTSVGTADGIAGSKFTTAVKAYQKTIGATVDGEITAKQKTWKNLLGLA